MELSQYIIDTAMSMKQTSITQSIGTAVMKKSMEMSQQAVEGTLEMLDAAPARTFPGDIGAIFDARA